MTAFNRVRRFGQSFRFRLFMIFTLGTALVTVILTSSYILHETAALRTRSTERARLLASVLAANAHLPLFGGDGTTLRRLADEMRQLPEVAEVLISGHGPAPIEIRSGKAASDTISVSLPVVSRPDNDLENLAMAGEGMKPIRLGEVRISLSTAGQQHAIRTQATSTALYATLFWMLVVTVSYAALRRLTDSFQRLMEGLAAMRAGNLKIRLPLTGSDEPSQAARAVNELAGALQLREEENSRLQTELLNSMRIRMEEDKQQIMAKLIQTNRMTSLGLLVSSMAHEINNPNGAIRLDGNFLVRMLHEAAPALEHAAREDAGFRIGGLRLDEAREELFRAAENIIRNTNRIETVIKDLRSYSLGADKPFLPDTDLNRVVAGALTIIRAHGHFTNADISGEPAPDLPGVNGSHHQLEQVVVNLLLNALQSLPSQGGTVVVGTAFDPASNEVVVSVRDTGEGITPENLARLFEPFFSTRIKSGGSGLGLYISNFIVGEHGGRLEFDSEVGSGTIVRMRLPAAHPSPAAQRG